MGKQSDPVCLYVFVYVFVYVTHRSAPLCHQLCPHLPWRTSFILLGVLGLAWLPLWCLLYPNTGDAESEGFMSRVSGAGEGSCY